MLHISQTAQHTQGALQTNRSQIDTKVSNSPGFDVALKQASQAPVTENREVAATVAPEEAKITSLLPDTLQRPGALPLYTPETGITPEALRGVLSRDEMGTLETILAELGLTGSNSAGKATAGESLAHPMPKGVEEQWISLINGLSAEMRAGLTKLFYGERKHVDALADAKAAGMDLNGIAQKLLATLEGEQEEVVPATFRAWRLRIDDLDQHVQNLNPASESA
uniref:Uncharacterized protein n=1 Tax=Magnetococcus massalia (strain MO-1) TaxID=451514 RepID=A0A1S7LKF6_MAGMO|nr:conserved protein of unknown function [Candidatus Magnetococcus massalia]